MTPEPLAVPALIPAPEPCRQRATRICRAEIATLEPFRHWSTNPPSSRIPGHSSLN
ncbi:hypothetical protein [Actinomadura harenae]|uniref:hypothetical protein n=1 Tax=Actinomadura harenae TaxID=2483351 RepID=UPI0013155365|nr:hypothetical protein [Actinomadura harenae]